MQNKKIEVTINELTEMLDTTDALLAHKLSLSLAEAVIITREAIIEEIRKCVLLRKYILSKYLKDEQTDALLSLESIKRTILVADISLKQMTEYEVPEKGLGLMERLFDTKQDMESTK